MSVIYRGQSVSHMLYIYARYAVYNCSVYEIYLSSLIKAEI